MNYCINHIYTRGRERGGGGGGGGGGVASRSNFDKMIDVSFTYSGAFMFSRQPTFASHILIKNLL